MTWFLLYIYNLREPTLVVGILSLIVCAVIAKWSSTTRTKNVIGSSAHIAAVERQLVCLKGSLLIGASAAIIWAIPSPDYDVRYKIKEVTVVQKVPVNVYSGVKVIHDTPAYQTVYDKCISSYSRSIDNDTIQLCHKNALEATQTVRIEYRNSPFKELFDDCNNSYSIDEKDHGPNGETAALIRNQRLEICNKMATQGSH